MKILVTGGGGFLGHALCKGLVEQGHDVASYNRGHYRTLEPLGVRQIQGDLANREAMIAACAGMDAVFHNAAKAGAWGSEESYRLANVVGTQNVLAGCHAHGVGRLIHTSTPSVTHRATHPVENGSADTVPYGEGFKAPYAATKTIAEKAVLAANTADLATVALRPRLIWGPGDQQLLPRLVSRAKAGRLRFIGGGHNVIDTTYIDNAAQAAVVQPQPVQHGRGQPLFNPGIKVKSVGVQNLLPPPPDGIGSRDQGCSFPFGRGIGKLSRRRAGLAADLDHQVGELTIHYASFQSGPRSF